MTRRLLKSAGVFAAAAALLLGAEILVASRRDYFRKGPDEQIRGSFGSEELPELRLVVMGDSTSVGVGSDTQNAFPRLLAERLSTDHHVKLFVVGASGARAHDVAVRQLPQAISLEPDVLLMAIGANDATHLTPVGKIKQSVRRVVEVASRTDITLVVVGPPDMGTTRAFAEPLRTLSGWSGRRVQRAIEGEVLSQGIPYVDLASGTGAAFDREPKKYYSRDMFHPGPEGYRLWTEVMLPVVRGAAAKAAPSAGALRRPR